MQIHMADLVRILCLDAPPEKANSYYVSCPCCDVGTHKKHLNINFAKEVFRCPKCDVSGGVLDLYALFMNIPRKNAFEELKKHYDLDISVNPRERYAVSGVEEYPITDVETRHNTYSHLLDMLTLSSVHLANLSGRGLSDDDIVKNGYKSAPLIGVSLLAQRLLSEGCSLPGVPGFFRDDRGKWALKSTNSGILIPVRDINGLIQGMQIRLDNTASRKYRWISSAGLSDGTPAESCIHFVGKIEDNIIITEGPLKADIINKYTGRSVLAVPGVNNLSHLKPMLYQLKNAGVTSFMTAFDMDIYLNPHVQQGCASLQNILEEMGFKYGTYTWDTKYKGLDDYLQHKYSGK